MNFFKHLNTVCHHKWLVFVHCMKVGLVWQGIVHDLSKFSPVEFFNGVKYYKGVSSPIGAERKDRGYSLAWLHHKGRNRHHYEYWYDYNKEADMYIPVKMPEKYVIEMYCDMLSADKVYKKENHRDDCGVEYIKNAGFKDKMHPDSYKLISNLFEYLAAHGEKETFAYIRRMRREKKYDL